jgi:hypothetical protein
VSERLHLPDVTLFLLDTIVHDLSRLALRDTLRRIEPGAIVIVSDRDIRDEHTASARWIYHEPFSDRRAIEPFGWRVAPDFIQTSHALTIQWDGWVLDQHQWMGSWLDLDFIGAPWNLPGPYKVGNGGFCLQSRRLIKYVQHHLSFQPGEIPSDDLLCRTYRPDLERTGFRWALLDTAFQFSVETWIPAGHKGSFGYHGLWNWPLFLTRDEIAERLPFCNEYVRSTPMWGAFVLACRQRGYEFVK